MLRQTPLSRSAVRLTAYRTRLSCNTTEAAKKASNIRGKTLQEGAHDAIDWTKKPAIDQAEDLVKFGEKAATAPLAMPRPA